MTVNVNFTKSGMGIEEGTLTRWLKAVGDKVKQGEPIAEIETAKAIQEIEAPASGRLARILVSAGEEIAVNTTLAVIEDDHG